MHRQESTMTITDKEESSSPGNDALYQGHFYTQTWVRTMYTGYSKVQ